MTKGGMLKHLTACTQRQSVIEQTDRKRGEKETLFHLQVRDAWAGDFWLNLEMRGTASLEELDQYLRAIWLECCGHLSRFSVGSWGSPEISMELCGQDVFEPELELTHIYDFGTSSETLIKVAGAREGCPTTPYPIALMARNLLPEAHCIECGQPATWFCMECLYETEEAGTLCDRHAHGHPHTNYGDPIPLVNSPRLGMCGYDGPADPPY